MSKQTVTYCYCDICQKEGAKNYNALAYRTFSETDSSCKYDKPVFQTVNIDLCDECAGILNQYQYERGNITVREEKEFILYCTAISTYLYRLCEKN